MPTHLSSTMGNRHVMKTQRRFERDRVIEAQKADLEADIARKSATYQTMMRSPWIGIKNGRPTGIYHKPLS